MVNYDAIFKSVGQKYSIDPNIIKAIAETESNFNPNAEGDLNLANTPLGSSAGMFQFREGTAKDYGLIDDQGNDFRKDEEKAADAAARKLKADADYFRNKYPGTNEDEIQRLAIEAYNGGRGGVNTSATKGYSEKVLLAANTYAQTTTDVQPIPDDILQILDGMNLEDKEEKKEKPSEIEELPADVLEIINNMGIEDKPQAPTLDSSKRPSVDVNDAEDLYQATTKTRLPPLKQTKEIDLKSDESFRIIKEYLITRLGVKELQEDNLDLEDDSIKTREAYIERFLSHMRFVQWNTSLGGVPELNYIWNATDANAIIAARAHDLYDEMPDFYDGIGEGLGESIVYGLLDPSNLVSFGAGAVLKHKLASKGIKTLIKERLKKDILKKDKRLKGIDKKKKDKKDLTEEETKDIKDLDKQLQKKYEDKLAAEGRQILEEKEIKAVNTKAMLLGGGTEAGLAMYGAAIDNKINKDLNYRSNQLILRKQAESGLITPETYEKELRKLINEKELDMNLVAINGALGLITGGIFSRIGTGLIGSKLPFLEKEKGTQIKLESGLEQLESTIDKDSPTPFIDLPKAMKLFITKTDEEANEMVQVDSIMGSIDFSKLDMSTIKLKEKRYKKYKSGKDLEAAIKDKRESLEKFLEADIQDVLPESIRNIKTKYTQSVMHRDTFKKALGVAYEIIMSDQDRFKNEINGYIAKEYKIGEVLSSVFGRIKNSKIGEEQLADLLKRQGLTTKDFENALGATASEAGGLLAELKNFGEAIRKYTDLNPEFKGLIDKNFARQKMRDTVTGFGELKEIIKNLERNSKAFVVSSIATTVRNVYGTTIGLTLGNATNILDRGLYITSKTINSLRKGKFQEGIIDFTKLSREGIQDLLEGVINLITFKPLRDATQTANVFEKLLENDLRTKNLLLNSLQEVGDQNKLWNISKLANTFNIAQDAFFRRAIFVNSARRQLKDVGLDLDDQVRKGRKLPMSIIKNASDEALLGTFAKLPDVIKDPKNIEEQTTSLAGSFIRFLENFPGASIAVPFPRFMANALAFQYKYSLFQSAKAVNSLASYSAAKKGGKEYQQLIENIEFNKQLLKKKEEGTLKRNEMQQFRKGFSPDMKDDLIRQQEVKANEFLAKARGEISRSIVGSSILFAAYQYRKENQDTDWFNFKDSIGQLIDTRAIFPIAPFLALADALVKITDPDDKGLKYNARDITDTIESISGLKLQPMGLVQTGTDIFNAFSGEEGGSVKKVTELAGKILGDFGNRFQQPLQPVYGILDTFDKEFSTARDVKAASTYEPIELFSTEAVGSVYETAMNNFMNRGSAAAQEAFAQYIGSGPFSIFEKVFAGRQITPRKTEMPKVVQAFDTNAPVRGGEFFSNLLGFRQKPRTQGLAALAEELNVNPWPTFGSTGDKEFDRQVYFESHKYLIGDDLLPGALYEMTLGNNSTAAYFRKLKEQDPQVAKIEFKKMLSAAVQAGRQDAVLNLGLQADGHNKLAERWFNGLSSDQRDVINRKAEQVSGSSITKSKKFIDAYLYAEDIYDVGFFDSFTTPIRRTGEDN